MKRGKKFPIQPKPLSEVDMVQGIKVFSIDGFNYFCIFRNDKLQLISFVGRK